jgi:hypothetical protein
MAGPIHQRGLLQAFSGTVVFRRVLTWAERVWPVLCTWGNATPSRWGQNMRYLGG